MTPAEHRERAETLLAGLDQLDISDPVHREIAALNVAQAQVHAFFAAAPAVATPPAGIMIDQGGSLWVVVGDVVAFAGSPRDWSRSLAAVQLEYGPLRPWTPS